MLGLRRLFGKWDYLSTSDWKAKWIEPGYVEDSVMRPSPLFRKDFSINKKIISATAYITSHGFYEATINGQRIGDAYLTPGWTSYKNRLQYQAYDVTNLVEKWSECDWCNVRKWMVSWYHRL